MAVPVLDPDVVVTVDPLVVPDAEVDDVEIIALVPDEDVEPPVIWKAYEYWNRVELKSAVRFRP